jgi:HPt (histidine-containing phosphotransfer) domain-containing protein
MIKDDNGKIDTLITGLWQKHLPTLRERLDLFDRVGAAAASGTLDDITRNEALSNAHKLAGNLGMFGFPKGSKIASEMEQVLRYPTPETLANFSTLAHDLRQTLAPGL